MIDKNRYQIEILKQMLSGHCFMKRIPVSDSEIGFTDGYDIVILPTKDLKIRYETLPEIKYDMSDAFKDHPMVKDTRVRKKDNYVLAKLKSKDGGVVSICQEKFVRKFTGCEFFTDGGTAPVYAKDSLGNLRGMFLPVRGEEF